jgi:hypothetical protein
MNIAGFSLLQHAPGPVYRARVDKASLYYAPGYLLRADRDTVPTVELALTLSLPIRFRRRRIGIIFWNVPMNLRVCTCI